MLNSSRDVARLLLLGSGLVAVDVVRSGACFCVRTRALPAKSRAAVTQTSQAPIYVVHPDLTASVTSPMVRAISIFLGFDLGDNFSCH